MYTSACIESYIIEKYHSDRQLSDNCSSHTWNEEDDDFYQQFSDQSEHVKRELRAYIEDWGELPMNKND